VHHVGRDGLLRGQLLPWKQSGTKMLPEQLFEAKMLLWKHLGTKGSQITGAKSGKILCFPFTLKTAKLI
jgi:hypothetical protein